MAASSAVAECLQRVADAEARLKTELSSVEASLREVRSAVAELERTSVTPKQAAEGIQDAALVSRQGSEIVQDPSEVELASVAVPVTEKQASQDIAEEAEVRDELAEYLGLSPSDVSRAHEIFRSHDKDQSGKLDMSELKKSLAQLTSDKIDEHDIIKILDQFDKDMDGCVSFEEFLFVYCNTPGKKIDHLRRFCSSSATAGNRLTRSLRARVGGVKTSHVEDYLRMELTEEASCLKLPRVVFTFFVFFLSCQFHERTELISVTEQTVKYHIEENANFAFSGEIPFENGRMGNKAIHDVNTFGDFWSWCSLGLVPLLFPGPEVGELRWNLAGRCTKPADALLSVGWQLGNSSAYPDAAAGMNDLGELCRTVENPMPSSSTSNLGRTSPFLSTQSIIAGFRLQQEQLPVDNCVSADLQGRVFDGECTGFGGFWSPPSIDGLMGMDANLVDKPGAKTVYMLSHTAQGEVLRRLLDLENSAWLNQRTKKIEFLFTTYNPDTNVFTALYIYFGINRAGFIQKLVKPVSIDLTVYGSLLSYISDVTFYVCILFMATHEGRSLIRVCRARGVKHGAYHYFGFTEVVDWIAVFFSLFVCGCWVQECQLRHHLNLKLLSGDTNLPGTWAHEADRIYFFEEVDKIVRVVMRNQLVFGVYPLCLGLRFFDAFSGQPRLALVTQTLKTASKDVLHFGLVVISMLLVFALSGQIIFGLDVEAFSSFDRALVVLFEGMIEGFDKSELLRVNEHLANVWGFLFVVVLQVLMTNMLLAIIFDVYSEVKSAVPADAETIWSQSLEILRRWRDTRLGRRLSLQRIVDGWEDTVGQTEFLTVAVLERSFPGLGRAQALRILEAADARAFKSESSDSIHQRLFSMYLRIQEIQLMLEDKQSRESVTHAV
eukprot:TRINITY_DN11040_c0_g2_i1.p1 TRINITY_DN11040_c0_g2~~TRINITY_DN11040_c0_g2_i1.p1  ORF type:complete len:890 (+),score=158.42 TRINITY_DN11040_c0_g2_i1:45-2714(+)